MASFFHRIVRNSALSPALVAASVSFNMGKSSPHEQLQGSSSYETSSCEAVLSAKAKTDINRTIKSSSRMKMEEIAASNVELKMDLDIDETKQKRSQEKKQQSSFPPPPPPPPSTNVKKPGFQPDAKGYFYDLIPNSQLFRPRVSWPMWDTNWDEREPKESGNDKLDRRRKRYLRKHGVTKHIILIRHGQYDETHKEDEMKILTKLGREQAHETGKRLAEMLQGVQNDPKSPCNIKVLTVSNLARAKETADIIASHIPQVVRSEPDPLLNEGRPAHTIPSGKINNKIIEKTAEHHSRIEEAFQKYFRRADEIDMPDDAYFLTEDKQSEENSDSSSSLQPPITPIEKHEYEIIVCHANVIRYFMLRALQLPPEAWLRLCTFNCSLTYLTIRPTGGVSCRMLGDIGHLRQDLVTFSGHHGFNW